MIRINGKVFLNIQEAVGWLMANNALPFQCTANYAADTEISLSTIVNPSPAKVRIGSIVFFADSKAATVTGITDNSFTVGADHIDMGDIHHVTGDVSITGDLSVSNINVNSNANVGKLNSEELHQKYEGAIKAELHVDGLGIAEAINPGDAGRFETTRVIKPSEVKTEIYDTQASKRMSFRLPYFEASAGNHRLLTEEDLGGGLSIERVDLSKSTQTYNGTLTIDVVNDYFAIVSVSCDISTAQSSGVSIDFPFTTEEKATLQKVFIPNKLYLTENTYRVTSTNSYVVEGCGITLINSTNKMRVSFGSLPAGVNCQLHEVISK